MNESPPHKKDKTPGWDVRRLMDDMGGPPRIAALLLAEGMEVPSRRTLYNWRSGQISTDGLAVLAALARRLTPKFDLCCYLVERSDEP